MGFFGNIGGKKEHTFFSLSLISGEKYLRGGPSTQSGRGQPFLILGEERPLRTVLAGSIAQRGHHRKKLGGVSKTLGR